MSDHQPSWMPSDEEIKLEFWESYKSQRPWGECVERIGSLIASAVEKALAEPRPEAPLNQRLYDLVRYQRHELHDAKLLTDDEFASLVLSGSSSARRLEDYDGVRRQLAEQEAMNKRLLPMVRFGMKCFDEHRDQLGDLDGSDLQEWAEGFGLLHEVHVTEPCGESCRCAEWDDFPQECLRETDDVATLRAELAALDAGEEAKGDR